MFDFLIVIFRTEAYYFKYEAITNKLKSRQIYFILSETYC